MAQDCLDQAKGGADDAEADDATEVVEDAMQEGTQVDGVSGATISSTAAVKAINRAFDFLQTVK